MAALVAGTVFLFFAISIGQLTKAMRMVEDRLSVLERSVVRIHIQQNNAVSSPSLPATTTSLPSTTAATAPASLTNLEAVSTKPVLSGNSGDAPVDTPAVSGNFLTEYLKKIPGGAIGNFDYGAFPKAGFNNGDPIPHNVLSPPIDAKGKFVFPANVKRVKIDIGLSWNAPNSDEWLTDYADMAVVGVEPSIYNIMSIFRLYYYKHHWDQPAKRRFFIIPTAVDDGEPRMATFYQGPGDGGTSSLNEFKSGSIRFSKKVPTVHLKEIIDAVPEDRFPYIEHIKTDTQGNDVKALRSAGESLMKRVVYYSAEPGEYEKNQYKTSHDGNQLKAFMAEAGFEMIKKDADAQWTFLNSRYRDHPDLAEMDFTCH
eukprot:CAMPEP_0167772716 /NCGR_PEP_ID=MMETSP0111_2-20121227/1001_1 /TAXON_ID=91324 /ORGANISM="Lotharella globosa, Strain CCCM811" /LENGTH=369 /DNA_ID=CAMNT_0007662237 /DNA_START=15 /DNA_END=1124 /DNA_ORIENTATION=-